MRIEFIKDFLCSNFGETQGTQYKKGQVVEPVTNRSKFDPAEHIDSLMAGIAIDNSYAHKIIEAEKEKAILTYETKVITPEIKVIKAENKQETEKEKNARKMREYRAKKKGKKKR